jgi:GntR family uxuAB operon transcriptional repressor
VKTLISTSSTDIAGALRKQIASSRFALNERLPPERLLAEQFGVARGTVREALRQLEETGFVQRRPGSGTYVTWTEDTVGRGIVETVRPLELVDARLAVEPQMCRLAVLQATEADFARFEAQLSAMERCAEDPKGFAAEDEAFHLALAGCTRNAMIQWMMQKIHEVRTHAQWELMRTITLTPEVIRTYNRQHREVVDAIARRDSESAAQAMKRHLASARESLVSATV